MRSCGLLITINIMNTFEKYINKTENQDLNNFTKYLDAHELAMLEMHFLSFAKEQLRIHDVSGSLSLLKCKCGQNSLPYKAQIEIEKCSRCGNDR